MIHFMKYKLIYLIISLVVIGPGLFSLLTVGLRPSVDFTGGSRLILSATSSAVLKEATASVVKRIVVPANLQSEASLSALLTVSKVKELLQVEGVDYQTVEKRADSLILRLGQMSEDDKNELLLTISQAVVPVREERFETLGPVLGQELVVKTIVGIVLALILIAFYIVYQFRDWLFGLSAILATVHDSLVVLGIFSLLGRFWGVEVDTLFVTAVLTILSFSVHDTIVVYDRIREKLRQDKTEVRVLTAVQFEQVINLAVGETLVRSVNNSLTVVFMLAALFVLGGETVKWFTLALLIGTLSGTYSSPFVAGPLLIVFKKFFQKSPQG